MDSRALTLYAMQVCAYGQAASLALFLYDYILTFEAEITLVWASLTLDKVTILFLVNRYQAFLDLIICTIWRTAGSSSVAVCTGLYVFSANSFTIGMCIADATATFRTWVIWDKTRIWAWVLCIGFAAVWAPSIFIIVFCSMDLPSVPNSELHTVGCSVRFRANSYRLISINFLLISTWEFVTFLLILSKGLHHCKRRFQTEFLDHISTLLPFIAVIKPSRSNLMTVLYMDGLLFTTVLSLCTVTSLIMLYTAPMPLPQVIIGAERALHSILSSRIILRLRAARSGPAPQAISAALSDPQPNAGHILSAESDWDSAR